MISSDYLSLPLKNQNKELEYIIENISDAILIIDKYGNYLGLNKAARDYFGPLKSINDLRKSCTLYDIEGDEIPFEDMTTSRVLLGEKITQRTLYVKKDDKITYLGISGTPIFDDNGDFLIGIICSRDISKISNYAQDIKNHRDILYNIVNSLAIPVVRLSYPELSFIEFNEKTKEYIMSIKSNDAELFEKINSKQSILEVFPYFKDDENLECIESMRKTKNVVYRNNFKVFFHDRFLYFNLIFHPILDFERNISEVLIIAIDVTAEVNQKQAVEKVLKIQKEFFSFISHEFRTPLTISLSAIQALELICGSELSETAGKYIEKIRQSSLQQLRLVNNLLDITKAESGYLNIYKRNLDIIYLSKSIIESISLYASEKNIKIEFSAASSSIITAIDDEKYERILLNLLSNAIKFTPNGKSISVSISHKEDHIYIKVSDTGVGIPNEKLSLIFDRFGQVNNSMTRGSEGTGIGLCLVKLLVNKLDGDITVESKVGEGSTFTITFPRSAIPSENQDESNYDLMNNRLTQAANIEFSCL
ncbi:PAS domain-containing sensor histidine kinase [Clostridium sp. A1-XYC3]|uniref:histidine kinase n=1 Tax=Clostridium tanneri TaxID=3037988 RepID=A0ABU4JUU5_9CLOT|nr:PAS domain-containing sensor histidine kinase [Clostridium sp. A1-XYC3]MDW8801910.1 PAS domain-containing sensor histidine kinase [Clostridium sp. A1-XYC3]